LRFTVVLISKLSRKLWMRHATADDHAVQVPYRSRYLRICFFGVDEAGFAKVWKPISRCLLSSSGRKNGLSKSMLTSQRWDQMYLELGRHPSNITTKHPMPFLDSKPLYSPLLYPTPERTEFRIHPVTCARAKHGF